MANVAKVALRFAWGDITDAVTTFHVKKLDSAPEIDLADRALIANAAHQWWHGDSPAFPAVRAYYPFEYMVLADVTVWTVEPTPSDPLVSTLVDEPALNPDHQLLPPQVCWGISLRSSLDTRRGRGRMYLPAVRKGTIFELAEGRIPEDEQDWLGMQAAHLASQIYEIGAGEGTFVLSVYSKLNHAAMAVTHFKIPDRYWTQRRRAHRPIAYQNYGLSGTQEP